MTDKKKLFIKTYGCQMNVYDSGKMQDVLMPLGYESTAEYEGADMVVLNTCHIREKAADKMYSELGRLRKEKERLKKEGKQMIIAVAGCVGQAEGEEVFSRAPYVDIVVGPQAYHRLPELVKNLRAQQGDRIDLDFPAVSKFDFLPEETARTDVSAFLTIQEGCDKFCTFCVVPYTRGGEYSRPVADVMREAMKLVEKGARELSLLGQNVNAYHGADHTGKSWDLGILIEKLAEMKGVDRIRYTTSHPRDMNDNLYRAHRDIPKLMPYLHLPVQSGSTSILKAMNRKHTREEYLMVIDKLRKANPNLGFSSDFIVGYPGETDEDFKDTLRMVEEVGYIQAFSFKYSPRPGTPAAGKEDQVPVEVKDARLQELQALINKQQTAFNKSMVGKTISVLFDKDSRREGHLHGKSPYLQTVYVEGSAEYCGTIAEVKITEGSQNSLKGEIVSDTLSVAV